MEESPGQRPEPGDSAHLQHEQERDLAQPVLRAELAPYARDADHLERLLADAELVEQLRASNYSGREWDYVATELIKYGRRILIGWMCTGKIWTELRRQRQVGGFDSPPSWEWIYETWQTLADDTLVVAVPKFRDTVLRPGRWDPKRRASLTTFFIGQCLIRFPNVYRSWCAEARARQPERPSSNDDDWHYTVAGAGQPGFEHEVVVADELARELPELDGRTHRALALLAVGFDQSEVAEHLGVTRKTVEMIVRRQAQRGRRRRGQAS